MKNFEYWEKEIKEITDAGNDVSLVDGKPEICDVTSCTRCDLGAGRCGSDLIRWLYADHIEKPRINRRTKLFFDAIETGWVARDEDGEVCVYNYKPIKNGKDNYWSGATIDIPEKSALTIVSSSGCYRELLNFLTLDFIKWEDAEPWKVEDIRNLELIAEE